MLHALMRQLKSAPEAATGAGDCPRMFGEAEAGRMPDMPTSGRPKVKLRSPSTHCIGQYITGRWTTHYDVAACLRRGGAISRARCALAPGDPGVRKPRGECARTGSTVTSKRTPPPGHQLPTRGKQSALRVGKSASPPFKLNELHAPRRALAEIGHCLTHFVPLDHSIEWSGRIKPSEL